MTTKEIAGGVAHEMPPDLRKALLADFSEQGKVIVTAKTNDDYLSAQLGLVIAEAGAREKAGDSQRAYRVRRSPENRHQIRPS